MNHEGVEDASFERVFDSRVATAIRMMRRAYLQSHEAIRLSFQAGEGFRLEFTRSFIEGVEMTERSGKL